MNVSASKVLLGLSLACYGYMLRGAIFGGDEKAAAKPTTAPAAKELIESAAKPVPLKLVHDPFGFEVVAVAATRPTTMAASQPSTKPTTQATTAPTTKPVNVVHVPVKLQAILVGPGGSAAVINGQAVREGETIVLTDPDAAATTVTATQVGVDWVLVQSGGQMLRLKLPQRPTLEPQTTRMAQGQQKPAKPATPAPGGRQRAIATIRDHDPP